MLWLLLLILLVIAVGGGIVISKFLFLVREGQFPHPLNEAGEWRRDVPSTEESKWNP